MCLSTAKLAVGQNKKEAEIIIQISPVYESGLVSYDRTSYLMVPTNPHENFKTDWFFSSLSKKKYRKQTDLIDSISVEFKIYSIRLDSGQMGLQQIVTDRNNFGNSFLIPLAPEVTGVKGYLITLFTKRIKILNIKF